MTSVSELNVYEIAYLCGGAERAALAAVAAMQQDGRIAIPRTRHQVQVARRRASQPVERAVLDAVPDVGKVLGQLLHDVAHSAAMQELIDGLRRTVWLGTTPWPVIRICRLRGGRRVRNWRIPT